MKLVRFKDAYDGKYIYIDLDKVMSFKTGSMQNENCVQVECIDIIVGGVSYAIKSSVAEICALAEDRDPNPARILFGDKEDE